MWSDGEKLRKVRRHIGMTQSQFAEALEVKFTNSAKGPGASASCSGSVD